ncbi:MAG: hypothetical protein AB1Z57_02485 [Acidimicrobiia bacterium]
MKWPLLFIVSVIVSACASGPDAADRIDASTLTESWPCGYGFAVSDVGQTVAVKVYAMADEAPPAPGSLPHPGWEAVLEVGTDLMAGHCDDVYEEGEPIPHVEERMELSATSFSYADSAAAGECPSVVRAEFAGMTATTADGVVVEIGDLTVTNDAFGCFAG